MALQLQRFASSGTMRDFGETVAPWYPRNYDRRWVLNLGQGVGFGMSSSGTKTFVQYGENNPLQWVTNRFFVYDLKLLSEHENVDGSITAEVETIFEQWSSVKVQDGVVGIRVNYSIRSNGKELWSYSGLTSDLIEKGSVSNRFTLTVNPEEYSNATAIAMHVSYPDGQYQSTVTYLGIRVYNPNPKYKPWGVRKGTWKSLTAGWFKKRTSGSWKDKGQITQNKIRKSGTWNNQGKLGN